MVMDTASGLSDRGAGGYLYVEPLLITGATPRFLNPKGGSAVTLTGSGFLPDWASALGGIEDSQHR